MSEYMMRLLPIEKTSNIEEAANIVQEFL